MDDLSDDFKLSFRSTGEVNEVFSAIVARAARDPRIRYKQRTKPKKAHILNALILWLNAQPPEEQARILTAGMDRLNALLAGEEPPARAGPGTLAVQAQPQMPESKPKRKRG